MTRNMTEYLMELQREESIARNGWRRVFLESFTDGKTKTLHACARCGSLPHAYTSPEGTFALACTRCGNGTDDCSTGKDALAAWNRENKTAAAWTFKGQGLHDPDTGRIAWEQYGNDGIETVIQDKK